MLFNSVAFLCFLPLVYLSYRVLPFRGQNWLLLLAGYVFYGWWDIRFLFLIAFSTTVDFAIGLLLANGRIEKRTRCTISLFLIGAAVLFLCPNWSAVTSNSGGGLFVLRRLGLTVLAGTVVFVLTAHLLINRFSSRPLTDARRSALIFFSVLVNLTFLGFFKYFNFFVDSAESVLRSLGADPQHLHLSVVLPVGISFYTFQSLSYTIDVYRRVAVPTTRFWDFALYVAFFPTMVAGPIERARHLLPQLVHPRQIRLAQSADGLVLMLLGLFKKVGIADGIAPAVAAVFSSTGGVSRSDIVLATLLFALQIFCDFSGYSDIARGVSKLFGIELALNFNLPYFSRSPNEFWKRWHISLSSWLRDYLYIPLGGNRDGPVRTHANLFATMLLGGLWHGAAWNYVLWGGYQGALLSWHRLLTRGRGKALSFDERPPVTATATGAWPGLRSIPTALRICAFFALCCYGWLLFRASSFDQIRAFTAELAGLSPSAPSVISKPATSAVLGIAVLAFLQVCDYRATELESFRNWRPELQGILYAVLIFILIMGTSNAPVQFIYFQF